MGKHSTALCRAKENIGRSIRKNNVKYYECDKKSENLFQFESEFDADEISCTCNSFMYVICKPRNNQEQKHSENKHVDGTVPKVEAIF